MREGPQAGDRAFRAVEPPGGMPEGGSGAEGPGGQAGLGAAGRWRAAGRTQPPPGTAAQARCSFALSAPWVLEAWLGDRAAPRGSINPAPLPSALTSAPKRPRALPAIPTVSHREDQAVWGPTKWGLRVGRQKTRQCWALVLGEGQLTALRRASLSTGRGRRACRGPSAEGRDAVL